MERKLPKILVLLEASRAYDRGILRGIAKFSRLHGPWSFFQNPLIYRKKIIKRSIIPTLQGIEPDGIIMREPEDISELLTQKCPVIICPYTAETIEGISNIITDSKATSAMGAEHLLERGFRNFGFCGFDEMLWSVDRGNGFAERIEKAGYEVNFYRQQLTAGKDFGLEERHKLVEWVESLPRPVGIMACNDDRAQHVAEACKVAGIKVPEEVAIIGIDNDELVCEFSDPPISSVALNSEKGGYEAAKLLKRLIQTKDKSPYRVVVQPTKVVSRCSTDILSIDDPDVTNALRFIKNHSKELLSVEQVADYVAMSRRTLERKFRETIGRSIYEEIRRLRLAEVQKLLLETNLSVTEIAIELNCSGVDQISRFFRQEMGFGPVAYRKKLL